jgi:type III restriction enzyme
MLLQLRNVSSESLNTQTVGRIMRNPIPSLEKNEITNKYYLYSNYQKPSRDLATYNLKNEFLEKKLYFGEVNQESKIFIENNESYRNSIIDYIKSSDFLNIIEDLNDDAIIYNSLNYGAVVQINKIINYVDLKIFNIKKSFELEKEFKISLFNKYLEEISNNTNKNIEKIKYAFYTLCIKKIKDIMKENTN